jgi:hypothetical protein
MRVSDIISANLWLDQFNRIPGDRELAAEMLEKFRYVKNVDLESDLSILLKKNIPSNETAALYVERELPTTRNRKPVKMYKEVKVIRPGSRKRALRAKGAAKAVVQSPTNRWQQVGSEGVIAQQLTKLCKQHPDRFILHPSAEEIRDSSIRHLVIVTDFLGSGTRIIRMLDSLWQVRSVRSWHSGKFISMWVMCYSGTLTALKNSQNHRSRPRVKHILPCPTLDTSFDSLKITALQDLCIRYGNFHKAPLGYGDVGALIAFEHSCPNNVPAVFTEKSNSHKSPWQPLFEKRSTTMLARKVSGLTTQVETLTLETLGYPSIAGSNIYCKASKNKRNIILLLAALSRRHRHTCELVGITHMALWELSEAIKQATDLGLVDANRRLTSAGRQQLRQLSSEDLVPVASSSKNYYYPSVLRTPC